MLIHELGDMFAFFPAFSFDSKQHLNDSAQVESFPAKPLDVRSQGKAVSSTSDHGNIEVDAVHFLFHVIQSGKPIGKCGWRFGNRLNGFEGHELEIREHSPIFEKQVLDIEPVCFL